jgi:hypothetical protein
MCGARGAGFNTILVHLGAAPRAARFLNTASLCYSSITTPSKLERLMSFAEVPIPKLANAWHHEAVFVQPKVDLRADDAD